MSYQAIDWAMALALDNPYDKLVLLALAHHHNRKTGECYPSVRTIAADTGMKDSGIRAALKRLASNGVIQAFGSTSSRRFNLNISTPLSDNGDNKSASLFNNEEQKATPLPGGATPLSDNANSVVGQRQTGKEHGKIRGDAGARRKRPRAITETWQPSAKAIAFAEREYPEIAWQSELQRFRNHYLSKGEPRANWDASFRNWIIKAAEFRRERGGRPVDAPLAAEGVGDQWAARLAIFRERAFWNPLWGPRPGEPFCNAPVDLLGEFGLKGAA